jgi:hypothetical protein
MSFTTKCIEGEHFASRIPGVATQGCTKCGAPQTCPEGGQHIVGRDMATGAESCYKCGMPVLCTDGKPHSFGTIPAKDQLTCQKCGRAIEEVVDAKPAKKAN